MSLYPDTNIVCSFLFQDVHTGDVERWLANSSAPLVISDWTRTEVYALAHRRVRGGHLSEDDAGFGLMVFDGILLGEALPLPLSASAGRLASELARDPVLKLSAADALHLACATDAGCVLVTLDARLAEAARRRGYALETP